MPENETLQKLKEEQNLNAPRTILGFVFELPDGSIKLAENIDMVNWYRELGGKEVAVKCSDGYINFEDIILEKRGR